MKAFENFKNSTKVKVLSSSDSKLIKGGGVVEGADNLEAEID